MTKLYFITTEHLKRGLWFRNEDDFKTGMNLVAVQASNSPEVIVLAFILMSNHVHFILKGEQEKCLAFVNQFKHRYSKYIRQKYGIKEFLRGNNVDVREIPMTLEAPEKALAYLLANCVAANICSHPSQYPWGSGYYYFNETFFPARRIGDISKRALKTLLHSRAEGLDDNWLFANGYILPCSYVDVKTVESIFKSAKRMNYFFSNSSKAKKRLETAEENMPSFRDQAIVAAIPDLCRSMFRKDSFDDLSDEEKSEFLKQLRYRFSADVNQLARVCGITYDDAADLLDRY